jgi:hypothetical protein
MASQNEYTGFIPASNPINWAKLTGGLAKTIQGIGAAREAERQALDQLQTENAKILQNTELGKSQTFNQLILSGSNDGRDAMMEWNKQLKAGIIKPAEYKNRINNLMDSWSTFANVAKTYDQQMQDVLKQQAEGTISSFGVFNNLELANFGDLKNKQGKVDRNSGTYMIGELGQDGLFLPSSVRDPRSLAKPGNIMDNKINLQEAASEGTKDWASWIKEIKAETVSGKLANPAVQKVRVQLANTIASNERAMASILSDNVGDYDFYINENQFASKLQERVELQNEVNKNLNKPPLSGDELDKFKKQEAEKLIFVSGDDQGVNQPRLTEKQRQDALQATYDAIDATLDKKITEDEPIRSGGGGGSAKEAKKEAEDNSIMLAGYKATVKAFGGDPDATISSGKWVSSSEGNDFGGLKQGYTYTPKNGGIEVSRGRDVVFFAKTPKDLAQYVYNGEPAETGLKWEKARKIAMSGSSKQSQKKSEIPSASKVEWKKAGWSDSQINQALKEGKIKVI